MFDFPASPANGQRFTPAGGPTYVFGSGVWKIEGSIGAPGNLSMADTPPPSPQSGQMWWESDSGNLFGWYNDGDSSQWVQINVPNSVNSLTNIVQTMVMTSGSYAKPNGLKFLEVTCVGGGGGSASSVSTPAGVSAAGAGGAGGGTCVKLYKASDLAATEAYTIGSGGAISADGGSSTFKGQTAIGGGGAPAAIASGSTFLASGKSTGGAASGGDININGGDGENGMRCPHGNASLFYAGGGGGSFFAGMTVGAYGGSTVASLVGRFPGGGARGTGNGPSQGATASGGVGAAGVIILKEYF